MPDPSVIDLPVNVWTLIAANILTGYVDRRNFNPSAYYITSRPAGLAPPPVTDPDDDAFLGAAKFIECDGIDLKSNVPTDYYMLCTGIEGRVLVTL